MNDAAAGTARRRDEANPAETGPLPPPVRQSEEFRLLAEHSTDIIARHTPSGRVIYASPAVRTLLGYEAEFVVGRHLGELIHPDDRDEVARSHQLILQGAGRVTVTYRIRHRAGDYVWLETVSRAIRDDAGRPTEIHATSRDVTDRKAAEASLERESRRMAALARLDLGAASVYDTLMRVCEAVTELLPADRGASVLLWDEVAETFTTSASTLGDPHGPSTAARARRRGGASRRIVDSQEAFIVPDLAASPMPPNKMTRDEGIRAFAGVPIVADAKSLGVLYALDGKPREYDARDIAFLETLAHRSAAAIVSSRLLEDLRRSRRQAEALNAIGQDLIAAKSLDEILHSVAAGAAEATGADWSLVLALDLATGRVERFIGRGPGDPLQPETFEDYMAGLTGWAIRENEVAFSPKHTPDLRESEDARRRRAEREAGSLIVAPLVYEGRPVGTLTVIRHRDRPDYTPDDVRLVESMAVQATVAIEQARLHESTRHALDEVKTLFELTRVLSTAQSVDEVLQTVVDTVAEKLPANRVTLFGLDLDEGCVLHAHRGGPGADRVFLEVGYEELLQGLTGWTLRYGRPAVSPNGAMDARESDKAQRRREETRAGSIVVVPLRYRGDTIGTMTAINDTDEPDFTERDVTLLQAMASQAAVAITDAKLLAEVQRLAITDALTGLPNRGHLLRVAGQEFNSAVRYRRPLAALMLDVDHFKRINDRLGHPVGDEVLLAVVERCRQVLREVDVFGRYGGEEFVVVLPETSIEHARVVAERLRSIMAEAPVTTSEGTVDVTMSIGLAHLDQGMATLSEMLSRADSALLTAKRGGRNRLVG